MSDHAAQSPDEPMPTRRAGRRERRGGRRRPVLLVLGVVVLVLLAWVVAVAVSGYQAGRALQRVADRVPVLEQQVRDQDLTAATTTAAAVARDAAAADRATAQFPYRWAEHVPWVGDQLAAVRGGAHAAALLTEPLPEALQTAGNVVRDGLVSADRRVDVAGLQELIPVVTDYQARVAAARSSLRAGRGPDVLPAISRRLDPVASRLDTVAGPLDTAARVLPQLPSLLGADGARTVLVAFTNPAEIRPVQGIVGAYAYLSVDAGKISLTSTGTDNELYSARADVSAVSAEYAALYGEDASIVQNVTTGGSADEAGVLTASLVTDAGLPRPDVVVFVDPVGLAQLLGTDHAPLELGPFGQVRTSDLAKTLMYDAYVTYGADQDARKAFLAATSAAAFEAVLSDGLSTAALDGARTAVGSGHLAVWSSKAEEQAALVAAGVAGVLGDPATAGPVARAGLTNTEPSKLDYWVQPAFEVSAPCAATGAGKGSLTLTLTNTVPETIPDYVANATARRAADRRTAQETVSLWVAPWVGLDGVTVDGRGVGTAVDSEEGWRLVRLTVDLPPGAPVVVTWSFSGSAAALPRTVTGPATASAPTVTTRSCTP
ncbi:DUF4012 domain-containing protein [Kineococcus rhizosphaerae]|uniref:Uncharacterized protein DUF4012 n=1 Tax=Kineococcus rhizosphaerae TaxID=559628 RepID=A0A2T0R4G8_9ACTN|nr:DUF4012 domain-containing protein [Kineococcus rhizosphaerae]PRY15255.1 uncharacterized protein DUF4012 [Kineococcus rhizosphaerae]